MDFRDDAFAPRMGTGCELAQRDNPKERRFDSTYDSRHQKSQPTKPAYNKPQYQQSHARQQQQQHSQPQYQPPTLELPGRLPGPPRPAQPPQIFQSVLPQYQDPRDQFPQYQQSIHQPLPPLQNKLEYSWRHREPKIEEVRVSKVAPAIDSEDSDDGLLDIYVPGERYLTAYKDERRRRKRTKDELKEDDDEILRRERHHEQLDSMTGAGAGGGSGGYEKCRRCNRQFTKAIMRNHICCDRCKQEFNANADLRSHRCV